MMKGYVYTSPLAKKWIAVGREEGLKEARDEGARAQAARSLMTVLRVRGIDVPGNTRDRISNETDIAQLRRWLERAVLASSLDEVFTDPS